MAKVTLKSLGNPDFGQDPTRPLWGVVDTTQKVTTLREASAACRQWIDDNELGGGNWAGGDVYDEKKRWIARVSYNGRVWDKKEWSPGDEDVQGDLLDAPIDKED